jgi:hypothetical protein
VRTPSETFDILATEFESRSKVFRNRRGNLVLDGEGVRAMTSRGAVVVKLRPDRVRELVESGRGRHYKDQVNAWLELGPDTDEELYRELITESLQD